MCKKFGFQLLSLCLVLCLVLSLCPAYAASNVTRVRTLDRGATLRRDPWVSDNNRICGVHANTELDVHDEINGWYYVYYKGEWGYIAGTGTNGNPLVTILSTRQTNSGNNGNSQWNGGSSGYWTPSYNEPYDMGVPNLHGQVYRKNQMNVVIYWVQVQMKATGIWYQGESWDCTGNLGDQTMSEIADFMRSRGYRGHSGVVDQAVVDELADWLGYRLVPVKVGGFYEGMNSIMTGGSTGSMNQIVSNMRDGVARTSLGARWVQVVLNRLGYYHSTIDGKYGEGTEAAVNRFQRDHGFQERDYVSLGVARAMLEQYNARGYDIDDLP